MIEQNRYQYCLWQYQVCNLVALFWLEVSYLPHTLYYTKDYFEVQRIKIILKHSR